MNKRLPFLATVLALGLLVALAMSGCANLKTSPESRLAIACETYAGVLNSLAHMREDGQLSDSQISRVDRLRPALNSLCEMQPDAPESSSDVVMSGVNELSAMIKGEEK
ncbi:MAG: hypothetical protein LC687_01105 [Actinobacteria bacterium]|nr:hypothetical protein [Actinomycetota bacterium]